MVFSAMTAAHKCHKAGLLGWWSTHRAEGGVWGGQRENIQAALMLACHLEAALGMVRTQRRRRCPEGGSKLGMLAK